MPSLVNVCEKGVSMFPPATVVDAIVMSCFPSPQFAVIVSSAPSGSDAVTLQTELILARNEVGASTKEIEGILKLSEEFQKRFMK